MHLEHMKLWSMSGLVPRHTYILIDFRGVLGQRHSPARGLTLLDLGTVSVRKRRRARTATLLETTLGCTAITMDVRRQTRRKAPRAAYRASAGTRGRGARTSAARHLPWGAFFLT